MPRPNRRTLKKYRAELGNSMRRTKKIIRSLDWDLVVFQELDSVISSYRLGKNYPPGLKGVIVHCYPGNYNYEVEFFDQDNNTIGTKMVHWSDIKPLKSN